MPFDPNFPTANTLASAEAMRAQLNALKVLIDAIPAGPPGPQGPPGEVTTVQLDGAIAGAVATAAANSSANTNAVNPLSQPAESNYNQSQMQEVLNKLDELILALRR